MLMLKYLIHWFLHELPVCFLPTDTHNDWNPLDTVCMWVSMNTFCTLKEILLQWWRHKKILKNQVAPSLVWWRMCLKCVFARKLYPLTCLGRRHILQKGLDHRHHVLWKRKNILFWEPDPAEQSGCPTEQQMFNYSLQPALGRPVPAPVFVC